MDDGKLYCKEKSLTRQASKDETDVNQILERYSNGGFVNVNAAEPFYGDVSEIPDYATALNIVREAQSQFAALPSKLRDRFNNNPQDLINFLEDDKNREEAIKLGLIEAPPPGSEKKPEAPPPA